MSDRAHTGRTVTLVSCDSSRRTHLLRSASASQLCSQCACAMHSVLPARARTGLPCWHFTPSAPSSNELASRAFARLYCTAGACPCGLAPCLAPTCFQNYIPTAHERSLAPYLATEDAVSDTLLRLARLRPGESFADLGAGDGRVLLRAVHWGAARATGWELDPQVHAIGVAHIDARLSQRPDLRRRIQLFLGDAREADVQAFGVVALYLLEEGHRLMRPVLERRLKKGCGTRIVAHGWPVPGWDASEIEVMPSGTRVYLYIR